MYCPLYEDFVCPMEDVYGACFFCGHALSQVSLLETEFVHSKDEDE